MKWKTGQAVGGESGVIWMFPIFGLISRTGEQVVGVVVYDGISCLFSLQTIETQLDILTKKKKKKNESKKFPKPQNETECVGGVFFPSAEFLNRFGFQWQCQKEKEKNKS